LILLTGATGTIGTPLLRRLTAAGEPVRCLVRDPRRLGPERVRVQIALGDLGNPASFRNAMRGVDTVVHLAAAIRDQPGGSIEELDAVATLRLVRAAEQAGVGRFLFFSAIGASLHSPARFFRAKALAEQAVEAANLEATVFAPSIVYSPGDPWITLLDRLTHLPVAPISGSGDAVFQPIWAEDVADCVMASLGSTNGSGRLELAGPEVLTYDGIVKTALHAFGRRRRLLHVPLPAVRAGLKLAEAFAGPSAFATWDEAELMELSMTTPKGTADAESLGVKPLPMAAVLGAK
jgi:NADH dehydrogenase